MKKIIALTLVLLLALGISSVAMADALSEIQAKGKLVIGVECGFPPFEYFGTDENGNEYFAGFEMDLARAIAADLGVEVEFVDQAYDGLIPALQSGDIDMIMSGMVVTEQRKEAVDFSEPYFSGKQIMVVRKADLDTYKAPGDFAGKTIGAQLGSLQQGIAEASFPDSEHLLLQKVATLLMELNNGSVEGVLSAEITAKAYLLSVYPDLAISEVNFDYEKSGIAAGVKKGDNASLLEAVNATIARVTENGELDQWIDRAAAEHGVMLAEEETAAAEATEVPAD